MRVTLLGTGTSTGVPMPGCTCPVCLSKNPKNNRLRTSVYIELQEKDLAPGSTGRAVRAGILIDTSPDLRYQALRTGISRIDAVLYTHAHADHIFGIDDLRGFNFISGAPIPLYANEESASQLEKRFGYCFIDNSSYEGGLPPQLKLERIKPYEPLSLFGCEVLPLALHHGSLEVLGFRFGTFAYLTDCSFIPEETRRKLDGISHLVIDGLRYEPHRTHFCHAEAVEEIRRIRPGKAYLTHISHDVDHEEANQRLQESSECPVECAYDGLVLEF